MRAQLLAREADVRMREGRNLVGAVTCSNRAIAEAELAGNDRALALALFALDASLIRLGHETSLLRNWGE